mmetsp:Transcript_123391/g.213953  ORF Transcript_123391/g.213953 Transcript_123391/m.213953 type:complete len:221 (-) Transcript_123391:207-869(-)
MSLLQPRPPRKVINAEELEAQLKRIYEFPVMKRKKKLEALDKILTENVAQLNPHRPLRVPPILEPSEKKADKEKWIAAKMTKESMEEMTERLYKRTVEIHKVNMDRLQKKRENEVGLNKPGRKLKPEEAEALANRLGGLALAQKEAGMKRVLMKHQGRPLTPTKLTREQQDSFVTRMYNPEETAVRMAKLQEEHTYHPPEGKKLTAHELEAMAERLSKKS